MIRLAFMTDRARVIGDSTAEGSAARFSLLPKQLGRAMGKLYQADNIVFGSASLMLAARPRNNKYVITHDAAFQLPVGAEETQICTDYRSLVTKYQESEEELLVAGGLSIFKLFLPYAQQIDVAQSYQLIPGDIVFTEWDDGRFMLEDWEVWDGFEIQYYIQTDSSSQTRRINSEYA